MNAKQEIARLVERAQELMRQIKDAEQQVSDYKALLREVTEGTLPDLMTEIGITEMKLEDGTVLTLSEDVQAGISEVNRSAAHQWLVAHGFGALIKTSVKVEFGAGDRDEAVSLADELAADHEAVQLDEKVHPQTLKSFVRERLAAGEQIPMDLFSVFPRNLVKIRSKK